MSTLSQQFFPVFTGAALKGTVVIVAAWLLALLLRRRSAAARHLVWTAAFAALLALPFFAISLPPLRIAGAPIIPNIAFQSTATSTPSVDVGGAAAHAHIAPAPAPSRLALRRALLVLWTAGAALAFLQMLVAAFAMWRVRRAARSLDDPEFHSLAQALHIARAPYLLEAKPRSMPMAFGLFRPAIFLPPEAAQWTVDRRRMVLLHELAHIRRGDVATHLIARTALALYWWNPLAWTAWRAFLKERERAADDLVLTAGARASDYAGHLLEVARTMRQSPAVGWAAVAMARPSQLEGRLLSILDARVNRGTPGRAAAIVAAILATALVAPLAALRAQDPPKAATAADPDAGMVFLLRGGDPVALEQAAKTAGARRQFDTAQKLLEAAVAIRAQVSGTRSVEYGVALTKLGDLQYATGHRADAVATYTQAVGVLGNRLEAAAPLLQLGLAAFTRRDGQAAADYFQQAQIADPARSARYMLWTALVRGREGNLTEAESIFRGVLALQDSNSNEAATSMEMYANLLADTNRQDEAASMRQQASDIRKSNRSALKPRDNPLGVYRAGGGVSAPKLLYKVEPQYTEEARDAKYQGTVVLYVEIGPDGLAHNIQVQQGIGLGLDEKAIEAVSVWKFQPGIKDGMPVTVAATIEVNFRLI